MVGGYRTQMGTTLNILWGKRLNNLQLQLIYGSPPPKMLHPATLKMVDFLEGGGIYFRKESLEKMIPPNLRTPEIISGVIEDLLPRKGGYCHGNNTEAQAASWV